MIREDIVKHLIKSENTIYGASKGLEYSIQVMYRAFGSPLKDTSSASRVYRRKGAT